MTLLVHHGFAHRLGPGPGCENQKELVSGGWRRRCPTPVQKCQLCINLRELKGGRPLVSAGRHPRSANMQESESEETSYFS